MLAAIIPVFQALCSKGAAKFWNGEKKLVPLPAASSQQVARGMGPSDFAWWAS